MGFGARLKERAHRFGYGKKQGPKTHIRYDTRRVGQKALNALFSGGRRVQASRARYAAGKKRARRNLTELQRLYGFGGGKRRKTVRRKGSKRRTSKSKRRRRVSRGLFDF